MITANADKIRHAFEQPRWYLTKTAYNIHIRVETVKQFVRGTRLDNILDIGCGDGSLSLHLLNENNRLTLLDRSRSMLNIASSRIPTGLSRRVEVFNEDFMAVQLPNQGFDLIICVGVLAYVDSLRQFLSKVASLLAPSGTLILECTDAKHFMRRIDQAYAVLRKGAGINAFQTVWRSSSEVIGALTELGFERCGTFRYAQPPPIIRKLVPQVVSYNAIRFIYGNAVRNRAPWLGSECIYHFKRIAS